MRTWPPEAINIPGTRLKMTSEEHTEPTAMAVLCARPVSSAVGVAAAAAASAAASAGDSEHGRLLKAMSWRVR